MMGIALSLLGIGKNLLGWLSAGAKWLFAVWYRLAIAALLGCCLWLYVGKSSALASAATGHTTEPASGKASDPVHIVPEQKDPLDLTQSMEEK